MSILTMCVFVAAMCVPETNAFVLNRARRQLSSDSDPLLSDGSPVLSLISSIIESNSDLIGKVPIQSSSTYSPTTTTTTLVPFIDVRQHPQHSGADNAQIATAIDDSTSDPPFVNNQPTTAVHPTTKPPTHTASLSTEIDKSIPQQATPVPPPQSKWRRLFSGLPIEERLNLSVQSATVDPVVERMFQNIDFKLVQQMCASGAGVSRARTIMESLGTSGLLNGANAAGSNPSSGLNFLGNLGGQIAPMTVEQSMCKMLGSLNRPQTLLDSIFDSFIGLIPLQN